MGVNVSDSSTNNPAINNINSKSPIQQENKQSLKILNSSMYIIPYVPTSSKNIAHKTDMQISAKSANKNICM